MLTLFSEERHSIVGKRPKMDSNTLRSEDFVVVEIPFENLDRLPEEPAVYAFSLRKRIDRLRGKSNIIYMGQTRDLRNRISQYGGKWRKKNGTGHRICENIKRLGAPLKLHFIMEENLNTTRADMERRLLERFLEEHHELPAWNRSGPKIID